MKSSGSIFPKLVQANTKTEITFESVDGWPAASELTVRIHSVASRGAEIPAVPCTIDGNRLIIEHLFCDEQEHVIVVTDDDKKRIAEGRVFSLANDLFDLTPYKGDFHMHSNRSDGKDEPAHVAAACRRIGLDFMALTDHCLYAPSLETISAFQDVPHSLRIYPGEEVHPPRTNQHIINFGGTFSVNELFADKEAYEAEITALAKTLKTDLPDHLLYEYASCLWCYDKIRDAGGLSLFCHPYWLAGVQDHTCLTIVDQHFSDMPFDAYEIIGGYIKDEETSNHLQVARYNEERAKGKSIPIAGVSDAHGCETGELFGWYYTIVFSPTSDLSDLMEGIKDLRSVAVEAMPDQAPRAYGLYRHVLYAQFLMREVFPEHDRLCKKEGKLMVRYAAGDHSVVDKLKGVAGKANDYIQRCFNR